MPARENGAGGRDNPTGLANHSICKGLPFRTHVRNLGVPFSGREYLRIALVGSMCEVTNLLTSVPSIAQLPPSGHHHPSLPGLYPTTPSNLRRHGNFSAIHHTFACCN